MRFYTNVQLIGNQFLVRGVENGKRYEHRDEFFPTLYVKSKRDSKYRTLSGEPVEEVHPGTVRIAVSSTRSMMRLMDLLSMVMTVTSINTSQRSILRMKSSLISVKSNW